MLTKPVIYGHPDGIPRYWLLVHAALGAVSAAGFLWLLKPLLRALVYVAEHAGWWWPW